jgi:hypothetical protein
MVFDKISHYILGLSVFCLLLTLVAVSASAEDDFTAVQEPILTAIHPSVETSPAEPLIRAQLAAIRNRDAEGAFSLTSEKFHKKYDSSDEFLTHLRLKLRPIYNHEKFVFMEETKTENGYIQRVSVKERKGETFTVIYRLEQNNEGEWLIDSFAILPVSAEPI